MESGGGGVAERVRRVAERVGSGGGGVAERVGSGGRGVGSG